VYAVLHREGARLFPDELFADLYSWVGHRGVPPRVVASVMVLQRLAGASDREAVERFTFDLRWRYACGVGLDFPPFVHTVLVDMRARLAASDRPDRVFKAVLEVARAAGLVGRKRVLDSTPVYDAVATQDTITLLRSAVRGVLKAADQELAAALRAVLVSGDDYTERGKPVIDWDDRAAREALIDSRTRDAHAVLAHLHSRELYDAVRAAAELLATVAGQDVEEGQDGVFRIARKVAKDRTISTADPATRHGHKTAARGFDGYKGHIAVDPDSEIITATATTPGNTGDAEAAEPLLADILDDTDTDTDTDTEAEAEADGPADEHGTSPEHRAEDGRAERAEVYGDAAYGTGPLLRRLEQAEVRAMTKTQQASNRAGCFPKDAFSIDTRAGTVTCPARATVSLKPTSDGGGIAAFGDACATCPLREQCTTARAGRTIRTSAYEDELARARLQQRDPAWKAAYRATRPKVERKLAHLMRHRHGGRRAAARGLAKVAADFSLLAAGHNLARLGRLGIRSLPGGGWALATG